MEGFYEFILKVWHSALPTQLARAICVAAVFELLVFFINRYLRAWLRPAIARGIVAEPATRVRRQRILIGVPSAVTRIVLYTIAILMILRIFRLDTRAEVIPIAFAVLIIVMVMSRNALRDVMRGYLILFDYDMDVGEEVTIGEYRGVVQELALRYTRLHLPSGETVTIPNGEIKAIVNHSRKLEPASGREEQGGAAR